MKGLYFLGKRNIFRQKEGIVKPAEKPLEIEDLEVEGSGLVHNEEFRVAKKIHAKKTAQKPKFLSLKL